MPSLHPQPSSLHYDDGPPPPPPHLTEPVTLPTKPQMSHHSKRLNESQGPSEVYSQQEFTFRNVPSGPSSTSKPDSYRPTSEYRPGDGPRRLHRRNEHQNLNPASRRPYLRARDRPRPATSDRPLLRHQNGYHETATEVFGVTQGTGKYLSTEDLDDTEEEDMDQSSSDGEEGEIAQGELDGTQEEDSTEPPTKRRDLGRAGADDADRPKWSNPDPYFVLPPVDHGAGKRKDPVETIRKYRKPKDETLGKLTEVAENDDFISFDIESSKSDGAESASQSDGGVRIPKMPKAMAETGKQDGRALHPSESRISESKIKQKSMDDEFLNADQATIPPIPPGDILLDILDSVSVSSTSDGRKRTRDSQIKGRFGRPRFPKAPGILQNFFPERGMNPVPWLRSQGYVIANAGFRLHQEVCDFFSFVRPQKFEEVIRQELLDRLQILVKKFDATCSVHCFGSFAAGLYLPNADMDVVILSKGFVQYGDKNLCTSNKKLYRFGDFIKSSGIADRDAVDIVAHAKVPLIKFIDRLTGIRVDMSFENDSGLFAVDTFRHWKQRFPAMPALVMLIKQFLLMRKLNEVQYGGIGGFTVTCLVTSLLQNMPQVQHGEFRPEDHLGEMLIEFLDFYGRRFDVARTGIQMEPPGLFDKPSYNVSRSRLSLMQSQPDRIAIVDPNNSDNDVSGGSKDVVLIFSLFAKAHSQLLSAMRAKSRPSLLDWMVGGSYQEALFQRDHLRRLYDASRDSNSKSTKKSLTADSLAPHEAQTLNQAQGVLGYQAPALKNRQAPNSSSKYEVAESSHTLPKKTKASNKVPKPQKASQKPSVESEKTKNEDRARSLKLRFPDRTDIPSEVTKAMMKVLVRRIEEQSQRPSLAPKAARQVHELKKEPQLVSNIAIPGSTHGCPISLD